MEEIRNFLPVSQASLFEGVAPSIKNAENNYLIPLIGEQLYQYLDNHYHYTIEHQFEGSGLDEITYGLIEKIQCAVIHLAYWTGFDILNAHITDSGFKRIENESVKGLYKYQEDNLKSYLRTTGFNQLDLVLEFLENHIDSFEDYKYSDNYTRFKAMLVSTTEQFNEVVFINRSRLTFLRVKTHLKYIEESLIRSIIGEVLLKKIKDELLNDSPAERIFNLLPLIRKPLIFLATALLLEESGADLSDNGLYFQSSKVVGMNSTEYSPANENRIKILVTRYRESGNGYLDQLRVFLTDNQAMYPEVNPSTGKLFRRDNTNKKTFWQ